MTLLMIFFLLLIVCLWALIFLGRPQSEALSLPRPTVSVPNYALWLPDGGACPRLEPPPLKVFRGPTIPTNVPYVLCLGPNLSVSSNLVSRIAAAECDFVSVFVFPKGGFVGRYWERLMRDFAQPRAVNDVRHSAAFADVRCFWFRPDDLDLPANGENIAIKLARARKAHGLPVGLFSGYEVGDEAPSVSGQAMTWANVQTQINDWFEPLPIARWLVFLASLFLWWVPSVGLAFEQTFWFAACGLTLGISQRLVASLHDGFSRLSCLYAPFLEPLYWGKAALNYRPARLQAPLESLPRSPKLLTSAKAGRYPQWLDTSTFASASKRYGGAAFVMDLLYDNQPSGSSRLGQLVDQLIHLSPAARAVRYRCRRVKTLIKSLHTDGDLLSLPCGSAADIPAGNLTLELVDPDPYALQAAKERHPNAVVSQETFDGFVFDTAISTFVYCGLSEYLTEREVIGHLNTIAQTLEVDGRLITSTTERNDSQVLMKKYLGWHTRSRSSKDFVDLLERCGFIVCGTWSDPNRIQTVFEAKKAPDQ